MWKGIMDIVYSIISLFYSEPSLVSLSCSFALHPCYSLPHLKTQPAKTESKNPASFIMVHKTPTPALQYPLTSPCDYFDD